MQVSRAWEDLHNPEKIGHLDAEGYLDLCLRAGIPEDSAQKSASHWALERVRKGLAP